MAPDQPFEGFNAEEWSNTSNAESKPLMLFVRGFPFALTTPQKWGAVNSLWKPMMQVP